jgi:hypothetical protein
MALVAAIGASVDSHFFYGRTTREWQRDVQAVDFESLTSPADHYRWPA